MIDRESLEVAEIGGIRTRYRVSGSGPAVVVLHGWGASSDAVGSIVGGLRSSCAVYAPDLPGFGESDPPPVPWGAREYGLWVRELMAHLGVSRASFIAHSHGGRIAIELAAEHPDTVERLILVDAAGIRAPRTLTWYRKVAMAKVAKHVLRRLGAAGNRLADALAGRAASPDYAATSAVMRPTFVRLVNHDLRPLLPRIAAPTLLIWGENDQDTPVSDAVQMERLIPNAGLVVFEGAGHFSYADQPQRFATIARHFVVGPALSAESSLPLAPASDGPEGSADPPS